MNKNHQAHFLPYDNKHDEGRQLPNEYSHMIL